MKRSTRTVSSGAVNSAFAAFSPDSASEVVAIAAPQQVPVFFDLSEQIALAEVPNKWPYSSKFNET